ncbi:hypothetical protein Ciccas_000701 [Cichlidogyrus casuarinus]|uniref:Uncharacterized protein n=1 Tax=Cichlidogyrus casuarinus TaxID=1844966 RepID=A0ABD2QM68_9PLAT
MWRFGPQKRVHGSKSALEALSCVLAGLSNLDLGTTLGQKRRRNPCIHVGLIYISGPVDESNTVRPSSTNHGNLLRPSSVDLCPSEVRFENRQTLLSPQPADENVNILDEELTTPSLTASFRNKSSSDTEPYNTPDRFLTSSDLLPITRRPLILVVEGSAQVTEFAQFSSAYEELCLVLLGCEKYPTCLRNMVPANGHLMTAFLFRPVTGLLLSCGHLTMDYLGVPINKKFTEDVLRLEHDWVMGVGPLVSNCVSVPSEVVKLLQTDVQAFNLLAKFFFACVCLK